MYSTLVSHPTSSPGIVELWSGICPIQAAMYFESERKDRENLHARLIQKEEELATKEKEFQVKQKNTWPETTFEIWGGLITYNHA